MNIGVGSVVKAEVAGTFLVLGFRVINGENHAQLKEVNPDNHAETAYGEMALPVSKLRLADQKYYLVSSRDEKRIWTNDGKTLEYFRGKPNATVKPARMQGDYDLFIHGKKMAVLFSLQAEQMKHLTQMGWL